MVDIVNLIEVQIESLMLRFVTVSGLSNCNGNVYVQQLQSILKLGNAFCVIMTQQEHWLSQNSIAIYYARAQEGQGSHLGDFVISQQPGFEHVPEMLEARAEAEQL